MGFHWMDGRIVNMNSVVKEVAKGLTPVVNPHKLLWRIRAGVFARFVRCHGEMVVPQ